MPEMVAARTAGIGQDQVQCGRLLAVEPGQHANAPQLRPPGHERIVVPHERSARLLALEVRRVNGPDLAVVALEVAEALAGRGQQERVGAPLGRARARRCSTETRAAGPMYPCVSIAATVNR